MQPESLDLATLASTNTADLLRGSARHACARGLADWLDRFIPSYADESEAAAIRSWILEVQSDRASDFGLRHKLETTLVAIALEAAGGAAEERFGGVAHPLLLALSAITGLLDGRGLVWESSGFQDLHGVSREILDGLTRRAAQADAEEAAIAACILARASALLGYAELDSALLVYIRRLFMLDTTPEARHGTAEALAAGLRERSRSPSGRAAKQLAQARCG